MEKTHIEPALVILAAGMGSRYGGLKQIDTVGNNGESIIDFSIYDAIEAGFKKVYLIIQKRHEAAFDKELGNNIRDFIELEYVYQSLTDIPAKFSIPEGREKPWGTTHALLSLKNQISEPFIILNADDYYGKQAFVKMYEYLSSDVKDDEFALMGYQLVNTLSESGSVTRGVCKVRDGFLADIVEIKKIIKTKDGAQFENSDKQWQDIDPQTLVSMNFWAFTPKVLQLLEDSFINFMEIEVVADPLKSEALLPNDVDTLIKQKGVKVKVLESKESWFGVTYKEDKPKVVAKFLEMKNDGKYPFDLWKK